MKDSWGRRLHYLRISVTDRCNLRCRYCMPADGIEQLSHDEILRFDEILRLARILTGLGVDRIRLTGGEPLVRKGLPALAKDLKQMEGISFLGLTTNGTLLPPLAEELLEAGVDGLNISLDTLDPERYRKMTRCGNLDSALRGLEKAVSLGFPKVKVNCVLSPESTVEDWLGVTALAKELPVDVRLIEWMPMAGEEQPGGVRRDAALEILRQSHGELTPLESDASGGPAQYFKIGGFRGRLGIISAMSRHFCGRCNRLRLTSTGDLKLCLFYDAALPLKPLLRQGAGDEKITAAILAAVKEKPRQHCGRVISDEKSNGKHNTGMYRIGG